MRVVVGTGIFVTLVGLLGGAIAWIVRSTPGSLVSFLGLLLVLPVVFGTVLGNWGRHVFDDLPSSGSSIAESPAQSDTLSPTLGVLVLVLWVVLALGSAAATLKSRDV